MSDTLYVGNSNLIELTNLKDNQDGSLISDATVTVTLKDSEGVSVTGGSWPVTLAAVVGTPGAYQATLGSGLSLTAGEKYVAEITVTKSGATGFWRRRLTAKVRD
jgi:hypothetical protein